MIGNGTSKRPEQVAREQYAEHDTDFEEVLAWHLGNGFVISVPYLFAMGYFYEDEGIVCHITYVCGDIPTLFRYNLNYVIDILEFQRNFSGKTKRYDFNRFVEKLNG